MKNLFIHSKLIGRDDHARFESLHDLTEDERHEMEFLKINPNYFNQEGQGGDSTLNMKNFTKSLKFLAGGDDSIFAIIDDRCDVWLQDIKNRNG